MVERTHPANEITGPIDDRVGWNEWKRYGAEAVVVVGIVGGLASIAAFVPDPIKVYTTPVFWAVATIGCVVLILRLPPVVRSVSSFISAVRFIHILSKRVDVSKLPVEAASNPPLEILDAVCFLDAQVQIFDLCLPCRKHLG